MEIDTSAGTLAIDVRGDGPPLWMVPANGRAAADFEPIRAVLARRYRTVVVDWPAMGTSPPLRAPAPASAAALAAALAEAVAAADLGPAVFLGHSVGAYAAACLAAREPARVRALVLVDSGGFTRLSWPERAFCRIRGSAWLTRAIEARFARWHTRVHNADTAAMIERVEHARRRPGYAATVGAVWRSFADPASYIGDEVAAIAAPTLLLWGARDPVLPRRAGRTAAALIAGARLVEFDCGHTPFLEARERFLATLEAFLAEVEPVREAA